MKLVSGEEILDPKFRKRVIEHLRSSSNIARKREMKKRHEVLKDQTVKWVIQKLKDEGLKDTTIQIMANRAANVSICRKIINKTARSYNGGVVRETGSVPGNMIVSEFVKLLDFNARQKKADRFRKLFKNTAVMTIPDLVETEGEKEIYRLQNRVLAPWQYDVLEWRGDCEKAACLILSDYVETSLLALPVNNSTQLGQQKAEDASREKYAETYIWWTDSHHFTTDEKGRILSSLSPEDRLNPIGRIPAVFYADDRDGSFWATGGEDLTDGSILVNTMLTDMNAIAYMQGWGQYVITGEHIPERLEGGPHSALVLKHNKDDSEPKVYVVNANPPLADWRTMIEQYVAILLSTNDCSPTTVAGKLDGATFPSGIAMVIEKSEAHNSIEDSQKEFISGEEEQWEIIGLWQNNLLERNQLDEDFAKIGPYPEEMEVSLKFLDVKEVVTEKEKLENLKTRKELGLNTELELIKMDNPDLTDEQARARLAEISKEKLERASKIAAQTIDNGTQE